MWLEQSCFSPVCGDSGCSQDHCIVRGGRPDAARVRTVPTAGARAPVKVRVAPQVSSVVRPRGSGAPGALQRPGARSRRGCVAVLWHAYCLSTNRYSRRFLGCLRGVESMDSRASACKTEGRSAVLSLQRSQACDGGTCLAAGAKAGTAVTAPPDLPLVGPAAYRPSSGRSAAHHRDGRRPLREPSDSPVSRRAVGRQARAQATARNRSAAVVFLPAKVTWLL